jgi:hypothetical protein
VRKTSLAGCNHLMTFCTLGVAEDVAGGHQNQNALYGGDMYYDRICKNKIEKETSCGGTDAEPSDA